MLNIFFIILIDMIGFGIMIPIFAYYVLQLGGGPEIATLLMAIYLIAMFFSAPILGRLSDKYGRKPILMLSMLGATIGYIILAFASNLWLLALSRLLSGAMAGNIAAAQAYISDITNEQNRAKGMGMIGAAFGIGFLVGPAIGTLMAGDDFNTANFFYPAITSAALSFISFLAILLCLKESLSEQLKAEKQQQVQLSQFQAIKSVLTRKVILLLIICAMLYNFAAGLFESIFPLWTKDLGLISGPQGLVVFLLVAGLTLAAVQGGLVGPLARKFGEQKLLASSAIGYAISMALLVLFANLNWYWGVLTAMSLQAATTGLMITSSQSLISMRAKPHEKGTVMGTFSSLGTLSRGIATLLTGSIYVGLGIHSSLILAALATLALFSLTLVINKYWQAK
ncbi:MFS transporter [Colwellia sp. MEBiC06753]